MKDKWKILTRGNLPQECTHKELDTKEKLIEYHEQLVVIINSGHSYFGEVIIERDKVYLLSDPTSGSGEQPQHKDRYAWSHGCYLWSGNRLARQEKVWSVKPTLFNQNEGMVEIVLKDGEIKTFMLTPSQAKGVVGVLNRLVGEKESVE